MEDEDLDDELMVDESEEQDSVSVSYIDQSKIKAMHKMKSKKMKKRLSEKSLKGNASQAL